MPICLVSRGKPREIWFPMRFFYLVPSDREISVLVLKGDQQAHLILQALLVVQHTAFGCNIILLNNCIVDLNSQHVSYTLR